MATGFLSPAPVFTAMSDAGVILPGAKLYTYLPGTTTPATVYQDSALAVPHANPVVMDASGRATIYLPASSFKFVLKTSADVLVWTVDPVPSTAVTTSGLGEIATFGGDPNAQVTVTSYPSGTGGDTLHKGTRILNLDSANLASGGTFKLEAMLRAAESGTITLGLMNISDGAPDTALVEVSSSSTAGARVQSAAITFPAGGASKNFVIKTKVNSGVGFAWAVTLVRTA